MLKISKKFIVLHFLLLIAFFAFGYLMGVQSVEKQLKEFRGQKMLLEASDFVELVQVYDKMENLEAKKAAEIVLGNKFNLISSLHYRHSISYPDFVVEEFCRIAAVLNVKLPSDCLIVTKKGDDEKR